MTFALDFYEALINSWRWKWRLRVFNTICGALTDVRVVFNDISTVLKWRLDWRKKATGVGSLGVPRRRLGRLYPPPPRKPSGGFLESSWAYRLPFERNCKSWNVYCRIHVLTLKSALKISTHFAMDVLDSKPITERRRLGQGCSIFHGEQSCWTYQNAARACRGRGKGLHRFELFWRKIGVLNVKVSVWDPYCSFERLRLGQGCSIFHAEQLCRTSQSLKTRSKRVKRLAKIAKTITYGYLSQTTITLSASLGPLPSPKAFSSFPMFYKLVQVFESYKTTLFLEDIPLEIGRDLRERTCAKLTTLMRAST